MLREPHDLRLTFHPLCGRARGRIDLGSMTRAELQLARKPNYDFEKRKKELERQAKKNAKREDRQRRRSEGATDESDEATPVAQEGGAAPPIE
ncbi:MAG: hypothetical protein WKG32_16035 [Gemmatimonadaceae bacterium]